MRPNHFGPDKLIKMALLSYGDRGSSIVEPRMGGDRGYVEVPRVKPGTWVTKAAKERRSRLLSSCYHLLPLRLAGEPRKAR